jgi:hypothetical protein
MNEEPNNVDCLGSAMLFSIIAGYSTKFKVFSIKLSFLFLKILRDSRRPQRRTMRSHS